MEEKSLGEILSVVRRIPPTASEGIQGIPIESAEFAQRRLTPRHPARRSDKNRAPTRGAKVRRVTRIRTLLRIQLKLSPRPNLKQRTTYLSAGYLSTGNLGKAYNLTRSGNWKRRWTEKMFAFLARKSQTTNSPIRITNGVLK